MILYDYLPDGRGIYLGNGSAWTWNEMHRALAQSSLGPTLYREEKCTRFRWFKPDVFDLDDWRRLHINHNDLLHMRWICRGPLPFALAYASEAELSQEQRLRLTLAETFHDIGEGIGQDIQNGYKTENDRQQEIFDFEAALRIVIADASSAGLLPGWVNPKTLADWLFAEIDPVTNHYSTDPLKDWHDAITVMDHHRTGLGVTRRIRRDTDPQVARHLYWMCHATMWRQLPKLLAMEPRFAFIGAYLRGYQEETTSVIQRIPDDIHKLYERGMRTKAREQFKQARKLWQEWLVHQPDVIEQAEPAIALAS